MLAYYGPNIIEVATLSTGHFSSGDRGLAIPALGIWGSVFVWVGYQVCTTVSKNAPTMISLRPLYEPAKDFTRLPIRSLLIADMAEAYLLALLSGLKPNPESCKPVAASMLVVAVGYLGYVAALRPYKSNLEQWLVGTNALILTVTSALNLATLYDTRLFPILGGAELAALSYVYLQMVLTVLRMAKDKYARYQEKRLAATHTGGGLERLLNSENDDEMMNDILALAQGSPYAVVIPESEDNRNITATVPVLPEVGKQSSTDTLDRIMQELDDVGGAPAAEERDDTRSDSSAVMFNNSSRESDDSAPSTVEHTLIAPTVANVVDNHQRIEVEDDALGVSHELARSRHRLHGNPLDEWQGAIAAPGVPQEEVRHKLFNPFSGQTLFAAISRGPDSPDAERMRFDIL
jgi:hypothetical protein